MTTTFALDVAGGLPEVIATSGNEVFLHLPGVIVAESSTGETRYLLSDGLGSVRHAVDESAAVVAYNEFDPYGNPIEHGSEPYGYTGEWWVSYIELLHLRARWYSPYLNQFISPDPIIPDYFNPQSLNKYSYVLNNPVNLIDPSGFFPEYCRYANTEGDYALCVARHYHVTPAYDEESGLWDLTDVDKYQGCSWGGSFPYKINGSYMEGVAGDLGGLIGGLEIVYDFATMERQNFIYGGGGFNDTLNAAINGSAYVGFIHGFKSQANLYEFSILDYKGPFISGNLGVGPKFASTGVIAFSTPDGSIWGSGLFIALGVSINEGLTKDDRIGLPGPYTAGGAIVGYNPKFNTLRRYTEKLNDGTYTPVDRGRLVSDIASGANSPFESAQPVVYPLARLLAIAHAMGAAIVHDAVYIESNQ